MEDMRNERLVDKRQDAELERAEMIHDLFKEYLTARLADPTPHVMPKFGDYLSFPQVRALINDPSDAEWTPETLAGFASEIPELISSWRHNLDRSLNDHVLSHLRTLKGNTPFGIPEEYTIASADQRALRFFDLAKTAYRCQLCTAFNYLGEDDERRHGLEALGASNETKVLFYPEVLDHPCNSIPPHALSAVLESRSTGPVYLELLRDLKFVFQSPVEFYLLDLDLLYSSIVLTLVQLVGLPPQTTTARDMDSLERHFCCAFCCTEAFTSASTINSDYVKIPYCDWREMV
jgi:hypothetical protein